MNETKFYLARLDRFGYTLTCISTSEEKARAAVEARYIKAFIENNGEHPGDVPSDYYDGESALKSALDDMTVLELADGVVEWL